METKQVRRLLRELDSKVADLLRRHREEVALVRAALTGVAEETRPDRRERILAAAGRFLEESTDRLEDRLRSDLLSEAKNRLDRELPCQRRARIRREVRERSGHE